LNLYLALKFLHVTGAAVLFGTGLGIAFFQFMADRDGDPGSIAAGLSFLIGDRRSNRFGDHQPDDSKH
jgi:uncharacterized membrane protein